MTPRRFVPPRRSLLELSFLFCLVLPGVAPADECALRRTDAGATIAAIYDGDTVRLTDGQVVRLIGVNAPEVRHEKTPAEPYADEAAAALYTKAPPGTPVRLAYDAERHDHYRRLLAHVFLADGTNLQAWLLRQGYGMLLAITPNLAYLPCYQAAENAARRERRGLWTLPYYQPLDAEKLTTKLTGFRAVRGIIRNIHHRDGVTWLELSNKFSLKIHDQDRRYFAGLDMNRWRNRSVVARGYVVAVHGRFRMQIYHPASLEF